MTPKLIDDCFAHDGRRLLHDEALRLLDSRIAPVTAAERVPLASANGRILAEGITAPRPVPAHTNSGAARCTASTSTSAAAGPL